MKNIIFRLGIIEDIPNLLVLHHAYLFENLNEDGIRNGFVKVKYSYEDFELITRKQEIAITEANSQIVGYYLVGHSTQNPNLEYQRAVLQELYPINMPKIACGAQSVIEKSHRGLGFNNSMLEILKGSLKSNYDYLFSSVSRINNNATKTHLKSGYWIVKEERERVFVLMNIS